jgi:hypothetical protein
MRTISDGPDFHHRAEWVRWEDTMGSSGWRSIASAQEQTTDTIDSLGFVLREDRHMLILAQSVASADNCDNVLTIPKRVILERWKIR